MGRAYPGFPGRGVRSSSGVTSAAFLVASLALFAPARAGADERSCPELRASYNDDPRAQTLFDLAKCEDKAGRIATAAVTYDEYLRLFDRLSEPEKLQQGAQEQWATSRREALARELPRVTLTLPKNAPEGTRITRQSSGDGDPIEMALNVPLLIDPGEHYVTVDAPGRPRWARRFFVEKGDKKTIELEVPPAEKGTETPSRIGKPIEPVPVYLPPITPKNSDMRVAAYVTGGLGIAGVVGGAVAAVIFGLSKGTIDENCKDGICNAAGQKATNDARTAGMASIVAFSVGGSVLATGVVLFVVDPAPRTFSLIPRRMKIGSAGLTGAAMEMQWTW